MSDPTFRLTVLTDEGKQYDSDAISVVASAETGYLGILAHHAPLLATLAAGRCIVRLPASQAGTAPETRVFRSGAGLLEVHENHVTMLTEGWTTDA